MKSVIKEILWNIIVYTILCTVTFLMLRTIIGYSGFSTTYAFLAQKQDYLSNRIWLFAFYTHVFTSLLTLAAGFTQFSKHILKHQRRLHHTIGKIYVIAVLFINVPTAFIMAIYANGLWPSKLAFLLLDGLWFYFTYKAWFTAVEKDFKAHRRWMIRSYALTFSAITLRTWKIILGNFISDQLLLYMIEAWMGFVPNILLAELILSPYKIKSYLPGKKRSIGNNQSIP